MIVIWNMGIGGIQTLLRDAIVYASKKYPDWNIYLLIQNHEESHLVKDLQKKSHAHILEHTYGQKHKLLRVPHFLYWVIMNYIKINPNVVLTFLDHLSFFLVTLKYIFFWRKVRLVLSENVFTSRFIEINRRPVWLWKAAVMFYYRFADSIIVPTIACKKNLEEAFLIPAAIITVISNWTLFVSKKAPPKTYDLIYVGRFEKEKNIYGMLRLANEVVKKFPQIKICLVGKGRLEIATRQYIKNKRLEKNVYLTGHKDNVIPLLSLSKIFLMTTLNEGMPVALLEAGSQKLPAIVSNFRGADEIVHHGINGYVVKSKKEMMHYISQLVSNRALRLKLGKNAQERVRTLYGKLNMIMFVNKIFEHE